MDSSPPSEPSSSDEENKNSLHFNFTKLESLLRSIISNIAKSKVIKPNESE